MTAPELERADAEVGVGGALAPRFTPDGVRRLEFPRTPIGRRGYNEADVEHFRARVVHEIGQSNAEKAALRQELQRQRDEVQRLRDYFRRNRVDVDAPGAHGGPVPHTQVNVNIATVQAVNVMSQAQQAADQHIAQAEDYARRLVANARIQYEEILRRAHEQAQEAAAEASRLFEAREQHATDADRALDRADDRGDDRARDRADDRADERAGEMQYLQSRLAYMRTFAQVTQVQLRSILDALRQELDQLTELPTGVGTEVSEAVAGSMRSAALPGPR
jgi:DivIVA domain-containing protein